jgi:hypothetical protein
LSDKLADIKITVDSPDECLFHVPADKRQAFSALVCIAIA